MILYDFIWFHDSLCECWCDPSRSIQDCHWASLVAICSIPKLHQIIGHFMSSCAQNSKPPDQSTQGRWVVKVFENSLEVGSSHSKFQPNFITHNDTKPTYWAPYNQKGHLTRASTQGACLSGDTNNRSVFSGQRERCKTPFRLSDISIQVDQMNMIKYDVYLNMCIKFFFVWESRRQQSQASIYRT